MHPRKTAARLVGLLSASAIAITACGGKVVEGGSGTGGTAGSGGSPGGNSSSGATSGGLPSGASSGFSSSGVSSSGGSSSGASSFGAGSASSGGSPGTTQGDDGGCSPSPLGKFVPTNPTLTSCWDCLQMGCAAPLAACEGDCSCSNALANAYQCANSGGGSGCFLMNLSQGVNDPENNLSQCLTEASAECSCGSAPQQDASSGCVSTGGGGTGGNGQCTSNFSETCGSTTYQVICACPSGNCACFSGSTATTVSFSGCPYCPGGLAGPNNTNPLFAMCGFPQ